MEKKELILEEVKNKYNEFFDKNKNKEYTNETESVKESKEFHDEIEEYINKRKKELEIE